MLCSSCFLVSLIAVVLYCLWSSYSALPGNIFITAMATCLGWQKARESLHSCGSVLDRLELHWEVKSRGPWAVDESMQEQDTPKYLWPWISLHQSIWGYAAAPQACFSGDCRPKISPHWRRQHTYQALVAVDKATLQQVHLKASLSMHEVMAGLPQGICHG